MSKSLEFQLKDEIAILQSIRAINAISDAVSASPVGISQTDSARVRLTTIRMHLVRLQEVLDSTLELVDKRL